MSITGRSPERLAYETALERQSPIKKRLIRANPYTCDDVTCINGPTKTISLACPTCNGTGYKGLARGSSLDVAPAATVFYIFADVQTGKGLYGLGGDFILLNSDLGKLEVGDAIAFTKYHDLDRVTGQLVHGKVDVDLPRPDAIIDTDGKRYTLVKETVLDKGDSPIGRAFTTKVGAQGVRA